MHDRPLHDLRIAVLAMDGVEEDEIVGPIAALRAAGASVEVVSQALAPLQAFIQLTPSARVPVDRLFDDVAPEQYDALVVPGGVLNADALRMLPTAQAFAASFDFADKPVAALSHGALLLVSADVLSGRTLTGYPSIHDDIENAGGTWVDEPVVSDGNLLTSRNCADVPIAMERMLELFASAKRPLLLPS